jgi:hypothetical protein
MKLQTCSQYIGKEVMALNPAETGEKYLGPLGPREYTRDLSAILQQKLEGPRTTV